MSNFPTNFRDVAGFAGDGLEFSTTSNTALKMYDALVNMVRPKDPIVQDRTWDIR